MAQNDSQGSKPIASSPPVTRNTFIGRRRDRAEFESDLPPHPPSARPSPPPTGIHGDISSRAPIRRYPRKHATGHPSSSAPSSVCPQRAPPLPVSTSYWHRKKLFTVEWIDRNSKLRMRCVQPNCKWYQDTSNHKVGGSGNLVRHYETKHKEIPASEKAEKAMAPPREAPQAALLQPRAPGEKDGRLQQLLLDFFVQNNVHLRVVDAPSFKNFIAYLSDKTELPSRGALVRDLEKMFTQAQHALKEQLLDHMQQGGRFSLTTNTWSTNNRRKFMAVTIHYIDSKTFESTSSILDVVELTEPTHSGSYMSDELFEITKFYGITMAIFTVSRDSGSPNDCLVTDFERRVQAEYERSGDLDQARFHLRFKVSNGDIRCFAHIINIGVQAALESLEAESSSGRQISEVEEGKAINSPEHASSPPVDSCLQKIRMLALVFRRRHFRRALEKQCESLGIRCYSIPLDMPLRWSSTYTMIKLFYSIKDAINSILGIQKYDESIHRIALTTADWHICEELLHLLGIFVRTTGQMQADKYPTLNRTLPEYFRLIRDLEAVRDARDRWGIRLQLIRDAAIAALTKMSEYFAKNSNSPTAFVATICDPRFKLAVFESLWKNDPIYINRAKIHFKTTYQDYKARANMMEAIETSAANTRDIPGEEEDTDDLFEDYQARTTMATSEYDTWFQQGTLNYKIGDIKAFWLSKGYDFKIIYQMARDHLGVPATSAASERVFSYGGDLIASKRRKLSADTIRYIVCLRDWGVLPKEENDLSDDEGEERVD